MVGDEAGVYDFLLSFFLDFSLQYILSRSDNAFPCAAANDVS